VLKEMYLPSAAYEGSPAEPVGNPRRALPGTTVYKSSSLVNT
jgi:hypothetical protein